MTQKKAPACNEGSKPKFKGRTKLLHPALKHKEILLYKEGFEISNPSNFQAGSHQRSKRGSVTSWSSASRRRMRRFMCENSVPVGWFAFGVSYTIPGDLITDEQAASLWHDWSLRAYKNGWAVVWRVEIQKREQRHWHCIVGVPAAAPSVSFIATMTRAFFDEWGAVVDTLGSFTRTYKTKSGSSTVTYSSRMLLPGALEHAVDVSTDGESGSWKRYIQDHASKLKQEQLVGTGRHWGIVGRKHFVRVAPTEVLRLSDEIFYRVVRNLQRLSTRSFPAKCVFGRKLGFRNRRGSYGLSVWFSKPETVRRLVQFYSPSTSRLASHPKPLPA